MKTGGKEFIYIPKSKPKSDDASGEYDTDAQRLINEQRTELDKLRATDDRYTDSARLLANMENIHRDKLKNYGNSGEGLEELSQQQTFAEFEVLQAKRLAGRDPLTGVNSRLLLNINIPQDLKSRLASNEDCSVIFIDFDDFKQINEVYGHDKGDYALKTLAKILQGANSLGHPGDSVYRFGGEEFIVFLPNTNSEQALEAAERLRVAIESTYLSLGDEPETRTVSLGVAGTDNNNKWKKLKNDFQKTKAQYLVGDKKMDKKEEEELKKKNDEKIQLIFKELLKKADDALAYAKNHGKNQAVIESQRVDRYTAKMKRLDEERLAPNIALDTIKKKLNSGVSMQEIIDSDFMEMLPEAFKIMNRSLRCPDTRTTQVQGGAETLKKFGLAGSGMLKFHRNIIIEDKITRPETNSEWLARLGQDLKFKNFIDSLISKQVKEVTSHEDCGAAKLKGGAEKGDDDGYVLASFIATEMQKIDAAVVHNHLTIAGDREGKNKMRGELHNERIIVLDGTGNFDPDVLGLPGSFLLSGASLEANETEIKTELQQELRVMCDVVDGHGYGSKRFKQNDPFYIFVAADTQVELDRLMSYAYKVANDNISLPIKVQGFVYDSRHKNQDK